MVRLGWIVITYLCFSSVVVAETQGTLTTVDGKQYSVSGFGFPFNPKDYYLKTNSGFVPLANVRQITRIGAGLVGEPSFQVITTDGQLLTGRIGLLFFNRVTYHDHSNGQNRDGFEAVLKGRASDGLLFTGMIGNESRVHQVEIRNPNDVSEMVLWPNDNVSGFISEKTALR